MSKQEASKLHNAEAICQSLERLERCKIKRSYTSFHICLVLAPPNLLLMQSCLSYLVLFLLFRVHSPNFNAISGLFCCKIIISCHIKVLYLTLFKRLVLEACDSCLLYALLPLQSNGPCASSFNRLSC